MNTTPALMTLREAGAYLRLDPRTVKGLVADGRLSGEKIRGRWRLNRASVFALIPPNTPTRLVDPPPRRVGATTFAIRP